MISRKTRADYTRPFALSCRKFGGKDPCSQPQNCQSCPSNKAGKACEKNLSHPGLTSRRAVGQRYYRKSAGLYWPPAKKGIELPATTPVGTTSTSPPPKESPRSTALTFGNVTQLLLDCAGEALVLAFLVQLFGGVVLGVVGGLLRSMAPTLPPGLAGKPGLESEPWFALNLSFSRHYRFALIFGVIIIAKVAARLVPCARVGEQRKPSPRLKRILGRVSDGWFRLVVVNAFVALAGAVVLQALQQVSLTHWLWRFVADGLKPVIDAAASLILGARSARTTGDLVAWFEANQLSFSFWLLYWAAIADDLGLPNFKTLGRWLWRRWCRGGAPTAPAT